MPITLSRRQMLAHLGAAAFAVPSAQAMPRGQSAGVNGRVVRRDVESEIAIPDVMVSNGRDVTLTGIDGSWTLPVLPGSDIFIVKPPHMRVVGEDGLAPHLAGDARPSASSTSITFWLETSPEPDRFDAILLADTQPDSEEELDFVRDDILASLLGHPAAFGIHHGDVVSDAPHLYPRYVELLRATGLPWHHCVGNHDLDRNASDKPASRETWRRTFGPRWYAFQYARAVFFVLDNVDDLPGGQYEGRFGDEQLAFVRQVLAHVPLDRLVVLSMHIPLRSYLAPDHPSDVTADFDRLLALLSDRPCAVSFSGHLHATEHHYLQVDGTASGLPSHHHHVLTAASGSWWSGPRDARGIPCADSTDGSPNGFHVLRVNGTSYQTEFVPAGRKGFPHLRAELHASESGGHCALMVNVFDGGPRTRVSYRVGTGDWQAMRPERVRDPMVCRMLQGGGPRKDWVEPTVSSHIWVAPLRDAPTGVPLRFDVRLVDEYGRRTETRVILEQRAV